MVSWLAGWIAWIEWNPLTFLLLFLSILLNVVVWFF